MSTQEHESSCKEKKDTRQAFAAMSVIINDILEKNHVSDFQNEQLRQLSLDCKKHLARWKQKSPKDAGSFEDCMEPVLTWELIKTPIWQLNDWIRSKIEDKQLLNTGRKRQ